MDKLTINNDEFFASVRQMLSAGHDVTIPVKGYSMLPFIRGGKDLVVLRSPGKVKKDDIVLFHIGPEYGGRYVMHRILSRDGKKLDIMGDGVPKNHEYVTVESVVGKAVSIIRDGKHPVDPYSDKELRKVHAWQRLLPLRRYILFAYRHLPWNRKWLKENK